MTFSSQVLPDFARDVVEGATGVALALDGQERCLLEHQDKEAQRVVGRQARIGAVDEIRLVARQLQGPREIDLEEVLRHREGALEVEAPLDPVGEDAEPDLAAGLHIDPGEVLQHLGGGRTLVGAGGAGAVEVVVPALGLQDGEAVLEALPLLRFCRRPRLGLRVGEEEGIGNQLAAFGGQDRLNHLGPAHDLQDRIYEVALGLRLVGVGIGKEGVGERRQTALEGVEVLLGQCSPLLGPHDAFEQIVARKQIAGDHD